MVCVCVGGVCWRRGVVVSVGAIVVVVAVVAVFIGGLLAWWFVLFWLVKGLTLMLPPGLWW